MQEADCGIKKIGRLERFYFLTDQGVNERIKVAVRVVSGSHGGITEGDNMIIKINGKKVEAESISLVGTKDEIDKCVEMVVDRYIDEVGEPSRLLSIVGNVLDEYCAKW